MVIIVLYGTTFNDVGVFSLEFHFYLNPAQHSVQQQHSKLSLQTFSPSILPQNKRSTIGIDVPLMPKLPIVVQNIFF